MVQYYICPPVDEVRLAQEVAPLVRGFDGTIPSVERLIELTRTHGLDASTMALYEALRTAPTNAEFIARVEAEPVVATPALARAKILAIPALFYQHYPETGGDAALSIGIDLHDRCHALLLGVQEGRAHRQSCNGYCCQRAGE